MAKTILKPLEHREIYFEVKSKKGLSAKEEEAVNTGLTHSFWFYLLGLPPFTLRELLQDIQTFYSDFPTSNIISVKRKY